MISDRFPFGGMDVAAIWLDIGAPFYIGTPVGLALGPYSVQREDRMLLCIGRP